MFFDEPTRILYWNIQHKFVLYLLLIPTLGIFGEGLHRRYRIWRRVHPGAIHIDRPWERIKRTLQEIFSHSKLIRPAMNKFGRLHQDNMHLFLFWGFTLLFIGTNMVAAHEYIHPYLVGGLYLVFSMVMEIAGIVLFIAVCVAAHRRYTQKLERLDTALDDGVVLALLFFLSLTGFFIEAARIGVFIQNPSAAAGRLAFQDWWANWSFAGRILAAILIKIGMNEHSLTALHRLLWWSHGIATFAFLAYLPHSKLLHLVTAPLSIFCKSLEPVGALPDMGDLESMEHFGVSHMGEFHWKTCLEADACTRCGRCQALCPAFGSGKPLSPKQLIQDIKKAMLAFDPDDPDPLVGHFIQADTIASCTTCGACQEACPVGIEHVTRIVDVRRHLTLMEGQIDPAVAAAFKNMESAGNPWGMSPDGRTEWARDLDVPFVEDAADYDVLYWVGCAGAYDDRTKKITRTVAALLQRAGIKFAVLGNREKCTGDPARRLGNEYLYQILAEQNIQTLNRAKPKKIVTHCPHCLNTLKNEYPQLGGRYEVVHHSEMLNQLLQDGRLRLSPAASARITIHDSCYLGRYNGVYDPPRHIVRTANSGHLQEMSRMREQSYCCGAGGGHMWMEMKIGDGIHEQRVAEALETNPETIATACPFCMTMMTDGVKGRAQEDSVKVLDISEILAASVSSNGGE